MKNSKQYTMLAIGGDNKVTVKTEVMETLAPRIIEAQQEGKVYIFSGAPLDVSLKTKTIVTIGIPKQRTAKKATTKIDAAAVLLALKASGDGKASTIATTLKCSTRDLAGPLAELVTAGTVVRSGKAKGTVYAMKANGA